jgi:hypothetical protein
LFDDIALDLPNARAVTRISSWVLGKVMALKW